MKMFCAHTLIHVVYSINRLPYKFLHHKSLYFLMHNTILDYYVLKVFGCLVYVATLKHGRTKFDPRSRKCIFLGHKQGFKGVFLFDLRNRNIVHIERYFFLRKYFSLHPQTSNSHAFNISHSP